MATEKKCFFGFLCCMLNLHKMKMRRKKFKATFIEEELEQISDLSQNPESLTDFKIIFEKLHELQAGSRSGVLKY